MKESREELPTGQAWLIQRMRALGYKADEGICFGLANMMKQAFLQGPKSFKEFMTRLNQINAIPLEGFSEWIEKNKKEEQNKKRVADVIAFFDGIELYHQGDIYPYLFSEGKAPKNQLDTSSTATLLQPDSLKGGTESLANFRGVYTEDELIDFLTLMTSNFKTLLEKKEEPIALLLNGIGHSIFMGFNEGKWFLGNPNFTSFLEEPCENTPEGLRKLARAIRNSFQCHNALTFFQADVYTTFLNEEKIKQHFELLKKDEGWKRLTNPSQRKIDLARGWTPLYRAAMDNNLSDMIQLLDEENDVDVSNSDQAGDTPLIGAIRKGNIEVVKKLIERGAHTHYKNDQGVSPLSMAILTGNTEIVKILIALKRGVSLQDGLGDRTPLFLAACEGKADIVLELLQNEIVCDFFLKMKTEDGIGPLSIAAENGHLDIVEQLLPLHDKLSSEDKLLANALISLKEQNLLTVEFMKIVSSDKENPMEKVNEIITSHKDTTKKSNQFSFFSHASEEVLSEKPSDQKKISPT